MSKRSLIAAGLLVPALALGQARGPTSPLDQPEVLPPPAAVAAPVSAEAAPPPAPLEAAPLVLSAKVPLDLPELLPPGVLQETGLTVGEAARRASERALSVQRAGAGRRAAEEGVRATKLGFLPRIQASARYTRLSDVDPSTLPMFDTPGCLQDLAGCQADPRAFTRDVVLQTPILDQLALHAQAGLTLTDLIGYQRLQLDAAEADLQAATLSGQVARDEAALAGIAAFYEVVRARAQLALARDAQAIAGRRLAEAEARRAGGLTTDADALAVQAQVAGVARLVALATGRAVVADANLRDLLEIPPEEAVLLAGDLAGPPPAPADVEALLASRPVAGRPDVAAARARHTATRARADADGTRAWPALTVSVNVDEAQPNTRIFPQREEFATTWDASVVLSWSLDGALIASARADQQRAVADEQALAARDLSQALERGVRQARVGLLAALAGVEAQQVATATAAERARLMTTRREAGLATETDRLDADSAFLSARLGLVDALVDAWLAHARLQRALGNSDLIANGT
ncbi:MAG: TolC family protein [Myxococcales bacterium]|nr:TolC family protein [Myxococcales bacterium]